MAPPGPVEVVELAMQHLPDIPPELVGAGAVGLGAVVVGGRASGRLAARKLAQRTADDYALPMSVREQRNVGRIERFGGVINVPRTGSILGLGSTRSGKTETGKHIVAQMRADDSEPMIIYDHKDDYGTFLINRDEEFVRVSAADSDVIWNIFAEIERDSDAEEIARAIFADTDPGEYFDVAGRQVFAAILKLITRQFEQVDKTPTNANLVNYFERKGREAVYNELQREDDLVGAASHLDPESSKQASGVYASVQRQINDTFLGDFAREGAFSIREYMHDPEGKALVLDYPYREGQSTTPLFRLLIDLAARESLADGDRGAYFVLDEVAQIPHLSRLDELVNVGAGRSIQVFITLQSVAQLRANYGKENASAILSGLTSAMILRCDDPASVDYARAKIADEFKQFTANVEKATVGGNGRVPRRQRTIRRETEQKEKPAFSKHEISNWAPGEGVLVRPDSWAYGRVRQLR